MTNFKEKDIIKFNQEQLEIRENLPNLYNSMLAAKKGNDYWLQLQIMPKWKLEYWKIDGKTKKKHYQYFVTMDKKLNNLLIKLKEKYCDNKDYTLSVQYNGTPMGAKFSKQVFEKEDIEAMLMNYINQFPTGMINVIANISVSVPAIERFEGSTDEHSNNNLVSYIVTMFEKQVLLPVMHQEKQVKRLTVDGETYYIKLNDLEFHSFEDIQPPTTDGEKDNGETVSFFDIVREQEREHTYSRTDETNFLLSKYKDIMTKDQLEKFETILAAVENKEVNIEELFHPVTGELIFEAIGKILYKDKLNNFIQPQVRNMIKSMKKRMSKELDRLGFNSVEVRSSYAPFPNLPSSDNKMFREYQIHSKYIIRDFDIEKELIYENAPFYKDEQIIEQSEIEKVRNGEMTVKELIKKYNINKNVATSKNGIMTVYKPSRNGEEIIDNEERQKLLNGHCKSIWEAVRSGYVKFVNKDGWMIPANTNKLNPITEREYQILRYRPLGNYGAINIEYGSGDRKYKIPMYGNNFPFSGLEVEIIKNRRNMELFNIGSHHEIVEQSYIAEQGKIYKYIDGKNVKNILNII
ncbi:hypothetical protein [Neobacillus mesonae]|uniref:hypothetical protein n=1 Tax=Neobacillus mesonae TaxID=1193713 RepID=UPI002573B538|nr:hypothetical protein [Neobacillus mesonae]